jgi:hypothetical protein
LTATAQNLAARSVSCPAASLGDAEQSNWNINGHDLWVFGCGKNVSQRFKDARPGVLPIDAPEHNKPTRRTSVCTCDPHCKFSEQH